jgi:type VII secretion protein EccB
VQTRRDQVQAHAFAVSRLNAAMLLTEPDALETPLGRTKQAMSIGAVIGMLSLAAIAVIGLIVPGTSTATWKTNGELVTTQTTGAQYLYLNGSLRPVANYASARLIDEAAPPAASVAETSLAGVPLGAPLGIAGAPADLPAATALSRANWLVCSGSAVAGTEGTTVTTTVVAASTAVTGIPLDEGLSVAGPDGRHYIIWDGQRLLLGSAAAGMDLGYATASWYPVSAAFLDALPAGPDLTAPEVAGEGAPGPSLGTGRAASTRIGELFETQLPSGTQLYQLWPSGLVPITPLGADLVEAAPQTQKLAYGGAAPIVVPIGSTTAAAHLSTATAFPGLPQAPPRMAEITQGVQPCVSVNPGSAGPAYSAALVPVSALGTAVAQTGPPASPARCAIAVPSGRAVLARAVAVKSAAAGGPVGTYLVTDEGIKYPLSSQAVTDLGYTASSAVPVPAFLLSLLQTGPDLTPAAAALNPDTPGSDSGATIVGGACPA